MPAGKLSFTAAEYRVRENGNWITQKVGVVRSDGIDGAVSVRVTNSSSSTTPGRAARKVDFVAENPLTTTGSSQLLSWVDRESGVKYCEFTIINDDLVEGNEFVPLSLGSYQGAVAGQITQANLIIVDDDSAIPAHRWTGTALQFQNPDGSWGDAIDLKGDSSGSGAGLTEKTIQRQIDVGDYDYAIAEIADKLLSIHQISASSPARIRGYLSPETRESDRSRPTYLYPVQSESPGILFDVVLGVEQTSLALKLSPQVLVSRQPVFVAVDNLLPQTQKINLSIAGIA